jgi:rhamnose transport system permease protein
MATEQLDRASAPPARRESRLGRVLRGNETTLVLVLVAAWIVLSVLYPEFRTLGNLQNVLAGVAMVAVVGVGMTMIILTGGIDVSVGSALAVCAVVVAKQVQGGASVPVLILIALLCGLALGAFNGLAVAYGRVAPIITTFATLNLFRFVALEIFDDKQLNGVPSSLSWFSGLGRTAGIPNAWWLAMAFTAVAWWYLRHYASGRHLFAIGSNRDTAHFAGIRVARREFSAYLVTGLLVGVASLVAVGNGGVIQPNVGTGFELQVIGAVVIGGTSILGGRGSVVATLLGALLVGTVRSALVVSGSEALLADFFLGLFILAAVGLDLYRQKREARRLRTRLELPAPTGREESR